MQRELQGHYVTISTVGEEAQAFVPAPLPPSPPIEWSAELREKFDLAFLALGRLDSVSVLLPDTSLFLERPMASPKWIQEKVELSQATVNACLRELERLGIVEEVTRQKRNRLYSYVEYIQIMNQGTELPG